ncbi:hypothetical protein FQN54_001516 [Arachnomyces sp. PD_36]|nr:hypothetical protein FQN54_001516 [Arachnomyces sp. PD_36]
MPSSNGASPVKRPAPNQRSVSSYAVPTRQPTTTTTTTATNDLSQSHKGQTHKFRPHVVGAQRTHARNPSYNKSLNKLQKLAAAHNPGADGQTSNKRSTVATSPRGQTHVRWNGSTGSLTGQATTTSMKKNLSTPALRRNAGALALGKKTNIVSRPPPALTGEQRKKVGFELADSDSDDEWEDNNSSQSPESTRRNSMAAIKASLEQIPSLEPRKAGDPPHSDNQDPSKTGEHMSPTQLGQTHNLEHDTSTPHFLARPRSSKAPPTMSDVSAVASSPAINRNIPSLTNISRRTFRANNPPPTAPNSLGAPGANPHGTSSSIEGGVSRFLSGNANDHEAGNDNDNAIVGSRSGSDPNTPSSFLPHYHLQRSPSNQSSTSKRAKSRAGEPHSRTQQKLWLQRTATLATSPPDHSMNGMSSAIPPSAIEPVFRAVAHSRSGSQYSTHESGRHRGGNGGPGGSTTNGTDSKHIRKIDEGLVSELFVVRRFRTPVLDSLTRVDEISRAISSGSDGNRTPEQQRDNTLSSTGNIQSAPTLANGRNNLQTPPKNRRNGAITKGHTSDTGVNQYITKNTNHHHHHGSSHVHFHDQDDMVNIAEPGAEPFSESPSDRLLSMAGPEGPAGEVIHGAEHDKMKRPGSGIFPSESEMMIRRLWDSREIGLAGD